MPAEKTLWEGDSQTLTAKTTSGRFAEHYSLTTEHLNVQKGIISQQAHQIRLADIADVDLRQSLTQRAMGTGDIILTIERPHGPHERLTLSWISEPKKVRDMIGTAIVDARQRHLETTRYLYERNGSTVEAPSGKDTDIMAKLERLGRLHDAGVVTDEEFEAKKAELLAHL